MSTEPGVLARQPDSLKELQQNKFRFLVHNLPTVNYTCQAVRLPGLSLPSLRTPNPNTNLKFPGTIPEFTDFKIEFFVDQNLQNYLEIWDWMVGATFPEDQSQRRAWTTYRDNTAFRTPLYPMFSDASLMIYTTQNNVLCEVHFKDIFPNNLSSLDFDLRTDEAAPLVAACGFSYLSYDFRSRQTVE